MQFISSIRILNESESGLKWQKTQNEMHTLIAVDLLTLPKPIYY